MCEQHDPDRWSGVRRTQLVLSADALTDLIAALQAHHEAHP